MDRKRVVILGAGISGLATAWYLRRTHAALDITLVEKTHRPGGWLHTDYTTGFHFEKGPRTFKVDKSPSILQLVSELDLSSSLVCSTAERHHRYLWHDETLYKFPSHPLGFLCSPLTKGLLRALLTEWKQPVKNSDETVWEFVLRRFNYDVARLLFDPLVVGIFGGDIRKISVRAAFPLLKEWEEKRGSITRGFFHALKERKRETHPLGLAGNTLFSFKGGMEQLSHTLVSQVGATLLYGHEAKQIAWEGEVIRVITAEREIEADLLFFALPAKETGLLLQSHDPEMAHELLNLHSQGIAVVSVAYDAPVLPVEGFGYLISTSANEDILGVVFDSSIFPEHNRTREETRLTIKLEERGRSEEELIQAALQGIRRHLNIARGPSAIHFTRSLRAIPQYGVGYLEKIGALDKRFWQRFPQCRLVGNYLTGVGVDACIQRAKTMVSSLVQRA